MVRQCAKKDNGRFFSLSVVLELPCDWSCLVAFSEFHPKQLDKESRQWGLVFDCAFPRLVWSSFGLRFFGGRASGRVSEILIAQS